MQPAFDEFRGDPVKPGPEINIDDDEELDDWIRENEKHFITCEYVQDG